MTQILNYGGGRQTIAMCALVATGRMPRPDYAIAADTGREVATTWQYAREHAVPLLARVGLDLHIAPHDLATVDLYGKNGDLLVPVFTETGKLPTYCSTEWKARVVARYARTVLGVTGPITNWIGFSFDERQRVKGEDGRRYPLLDLMLTRADCERIITEAGLPLPRKSRCKMCPHQGNDEWLEIYDQPAEWAEAVAVDEELRDADERGGVYLHQSRRPLRDLTRADLDRAQPKEPSRQCGLGLCFV
jgi:hypothetical protein